MSDVFVKPFKYQKMRVSIMDAFKGLNWLRYVKLTKKKNCNWGDFLSTYQFDIQDKSNNCFPRLWNTNRVVRV